MACRLCLSFLNDEDNVGTPISEFQPSIMMVLPQLDLNITFDPLICSECIETISTYVEFKKMAMENENKVKLYKYSYIEKEKRNHCLDIKQVFWHYNPDIELERPAVICRICFKIILGGTETSIIKENGCSDVLKSSVPELGLRLTFDPFCCQTCLQVASILTSYKEQCIKIQNLLLSQLKSDGQILTNNELVELGVKGFLTLENAASTANKVERNIPEKDFKNEHSEIGVCVKLECAEHNNPIKEENTATEVETNKDEAVRAKNEDLETRIEESVVREYRRVETMKEIKDGQEQEEGEELHRCPYCIYTSTVRSSVVRHMKYKHKVYEEELRFQCKHCPYQTEKGHDLKRHTQYAHRKPKPKVKTAS